MTTDALMKFKFSCKEYLMALPIGPLRTYGREVGVANPTEKKKQELIEEIVAVLAGELSPVERSKKGAPVKDCRVDPEILSEIEKLRIQYLVGTEKDDSVYNFTREYYRFLANEKNILIAEDPNREEIERKLAESTQIHIGQLEKLEGVFVLLPLNGIDNGKKLIVSSETVEKSDLREGDVVTCYAEKRESAYIVKEVLTVNGIVINTFRRTRFEEEISCFPTKRISLCAEDGKDSVVAKCLDWLIPLGKGQRCAVISAPKAGKTSVLLDIAKAVKANNCGVTVLALLIDQSPETLGLFRQIIDKDNFIYTTYDDEPERQVFMAEFLLKRAKRLVEMGEDVVLFVDSLNALAYAYNDTDASSAGKTLSCGLESTTIHYVKKYFGSARCFEKGGSLTMIASVSENTGNPADDVISAKLSEIANLDFRLSDALAKKRIYPAIDFMGTQIKQKAFLQGEEDGKLETIFCGKIVPDFGEELALQWLADAKSKNALIDKIRQAKL